MRFTKIKASDDKVLLEWTTPAEKSDDGLIEHRLSLEEAPHPEFIEALQEFVAPVLDLLELGLSYSDGFTITGLSVNYEEDGRQGLVVTCQKRLSQTNAPLILNTPHLREASDEETGHYLPDGMLRLLPKIEMEADCYIHGKRSQASLFGDDESSVESVTISSGGRSTTLTRKRGKA